MAAVSQQNMIEFSQKLFSAHRQVFGDVLTIDDEQAVEALLRSPPPQRLAHNELFVPSTLLRAADDIDSANAMQ